VYVWTLLSGQVYCGGCNQISRKDEPFLDLSLDMPDSSWLRCNRCTTVLYRAYVLYGVR